MKSQAWARAFIGTVGIAVVGTVAYLLQEPLCFWAFVLLFGIVGIVRD